MDRETAKPILRLEGVGLGFGGVSALDGVNLEVRPGEILALIGPNGSGKTSLLNCVSGFYKPSQGRILYQGRPIQGLRPDRLARLGVGRTFQNLELFDGLSVLDNLLVGRHRHMKSFLFSLGPGLLRLKQGRAQEAAHRAAVEETIDFLEMEAWRKLPVGECSYGMRQRIALGRALALEPELLLLDEPCSGLTAQSKADLVRFILDAHEEKGLTILMVEHDLEVVMDIAHWIVVLDKGRKIAEGPPPKIRKDPRTAGAYLGKGGAEFGGAVNA